MTDQEKLEALQGIMTNLYHILEDTCGTEAKRLWRDVPRQRRPGKPGPKGPREPDRSDELERMLALVTPPLGRQAIPKLAKALAEKWPGEFGLSQLAIEQHLRRIRRGTKATIAALRRQNPLPKMPHK